MHHTHLHCPAWDYQHLKWVCLYFDFFLNSIISKKYKFKPCFTVSEQLSYRVYKKLLVPSPLILLSIFFPLQILKWTIITRTPQRHDMMSLIYRIWCCRVCNYVAVHLQGNSRVHIKKIWNARRMLLNPLHHKKSPFWTFLLKESLPYTKKVEKYFCL